MDSVEGQTIQVLCHRGRYGALCLVEPQPMRNVDGCLGVWHVTEQGAGQAKQRVMLAMVAQHYLAMNLVDEMPRVITSCAPHVLLQRLVSPGSLPLFDNGNVDVGTWLSERLDTLRNRGTLVEALDGGKAEYNRLCREDVLRILLHHYDQQGAFSTLTDAEIMQSPLKRRYYESATVSRAIETLLAEGKITGSMDSVGIEPTTADEIREQIKEIEQQAIKEGEVSEVSKRFPPGKQAETPSDDFSPVPPPKPVEDLLDIENVARVLLKNCRRVAGKVRWRVSERCYIDEDFGLKEDEAQHAERGLIFIHNGTEGRKWFQHLRQTNANLMAAVRWLLPDLYEHLEILPVSDLTDLDRKSDGDESKWPAAERDWQQIIKAAGAERARRELDEKAEGGKGEAEDLQPTSCLTSLQVIGSGQVYDGWEALREILASASKRVDIEDAHINADVVALLRNAPDGVAVRVLTRKLYEDADPAFRRLAEQRSGTLEVRTTGNLHGRRIYVDEKAYILEDSIKDLASKTASSIVPVHEQTEARRLMEDFERRWATAGVNIRPKV